VQAITVLQNLLERVRSRLFRTRLPLLAKELVEQAARRRTYLIRLGYAVLLFAAFLVFAYGASSGPANPADILGRGRGMFQTLVVIQFFGILIFLPATMAGVIAVEKERATLPLLMLTDLTSRQILWQKFLGRVVAMLSFLLLGLPLLAVCYAFGGIGTDYLLAGVYLLVLTCLQIGALSLACSAFCSSSLAALLSSYILTAILYVVVPGIFGDWFAPWLIFSQHAQGGFGSVVFASIFVVVSIAVFLRFAHGYLVRRAFLPPGNALLGIFRWLDRTFENWNAAVGGIHLIREKATLPGERPIAWREVTKKSLGRIVYLFRILVILEVPLVFVAVGSFYRIVEWQESDSLSAILYILWAIAGLALAIMSTNAIASERTYQTLEVLLTTPLSGADILRQKLRGVRRLMFVLIVPIATCVGFRAWIARSLHLTTLGQGTLSYVAVSLFAIAIYLLLVTWFGAWVGLWARTRLRAIITLLVLLVVWAAGPLLLAGLLEEAVHLDVQHLDVQLPLLEYPRCVSPAWAVIAIERAGIDTFLDHAPLKLLAANLGFYLVVLLLVRWDCLRNADRLLGRARPRERAGAETTDE